MFPGSGALGRSSDGAPLPRRPVSLSDVLISGSLVLFLEAGNYKAISFIAGFPVDLTVAFGVVVAGIVVVVAARGGFSIPRELGVTLGLFAAFVPAIALSSFDAYSSEKISRLFTLTLLAAIAPLWLLRVEARVRPFLHWIAAVGLVLALLGAIQGSNPLIASGRFVIPGGNPIELGRVSGAALLWVGVLAFYRVVPAIVALPIAAILVTSMFASGSRGPVLAAGVAVLMLAVAIPGNLPKRALRLSFVGFLAVAAIWYGLSQAPSSALARFELLAGEDPGLSVRARELMYGSSIALIPESPLGIGWGDFTRKVIVADPALELYPHNIVLELTLEGGWLAGVAFLVIMFLAFRRASKAVDHAEGAGLFVLLAYSSANAFISGDVNDNRVLFALIAACLIYRTILGRKRVSEA